MDEDAQARPTKMTPSSYKCPVCKKGSLLEIDSEKAFGNVNIKFITKDGVCFEFGCKIKNDYFFLCNNSSCRARFERTKWHEGESQVGPLCPTINCDGSLDTFRNVPVGKVYPRSEREKVCLTCGEAHSSEFKIVSGRLSYDEAGICTQCHFVGPKEINLK